MNFRDAQILLHIKRYCLDIKEALARCSNDYGQFEKDSLVRHAISMCIMQMGELAGRLSDAFKDETQDQIMWGSLRSMRNFFAHEYKKIQLPILWESATRDTSLLLAFCDAYIAANPEAFTFPEIPEEDDA